MSKLEDILSKRKVKTTCAPQYGDFNCHVLLGDRHVPDETTLSFCVSVYRQSNNWLKPLPTMQCATPVHLNQCIHSTAALLVSVALGERLQQNQKGASIPDSSS